MTGPSLREVALALQCDRPHCPCHRIKEAQALVHCPAHQPDEHPSLSLSLRGDRLLWKCHTGCRQEDVTAALRERGLLGEPEKPAPRPLWRQVAAYIYRDPQGAPLFRVLRLEDGTGAKTFKQQAYKDDTWIAHMTGVDRVPYRLGDLKVAMAVGEPVYVVEGEKCADTLADRFHVAATTNAGGAEKWATYTTTLSPHFTGADVVILPDRDEPGERHAEQVARCLHGIAKRVRIVRLPDLPPKGDIADWIGVGHTREELLALVEAAESWSPRTAAGPEIRKEGSAFTFHWPAEGVSIITRNPADGRDGLRAEVEVWSTTEGRLHFSTLNLMSTQSREQVVRKLTEASAHTGWRERLEAVCFEAVKAYREGRPIVALRPEPRPALRYAVDPFMPLGDTTTLYGDGGSCKSYLALGVAVSVLTGRTVIPGVRPGYRGRVLFCDYETTEAEIQGRLYEIARPLALDPADLDGFYYREMIRPLVEEIEVLRRERERLDVSLVILDSLAPACGPDPESASATTATFNALRSLGCSRLVIAHVSKAAAEQKSGPAKPWGSAFVFNLSRSAWEIRRSEHDAGGGVPVALYHRKFNSGPLRKDPMGLRLDFGENALAFRAYDVTEDPDFMSRASLSTRVLDALKGGSRKTGHLAEALDASVQTVGKTLRRLQDQRKVRRIDGGGRGADAEWGIAGDRE